MVTCLISRRKDDTDFTPITAMAPYHRHLRARSAQQAALLYSGATALMTAAIAMRRRRSRAGVYRSSCRVESAKYAEALRSPRFRESGAIGDFS